MVQILRDLPTENELLEAVLLNERKTESIRIALTAVKRYEEHAAEINKVVTEKAILHEREECRTYAVDFYLLVAPYIEEIAALMGVETE